MRSAECAVCGWIGALEGSPEETTSVEVSAFGSRLDEGISRYQVVLWDTLTAMAAPQVGQYALPAGTS